MVVRACYGKMEGFYLMKKVYSLESGKVEALSGSRIGRDLCTTP